MSRLIPHREDHDSTLGPVRFTLRGLFVAMTLLGVMFGAMAALGSMWSLVILLFAGLVLAHVLGNSLGTRLRDRASSRPRLDRADRAAFRLAPAVVPPLQPSRLTQNSRPHRVTFAAALAGAVGGGMLGATGSAFIYPEAGPAALVLGLVSLAVLGALAGFGVTSFVCVVRSAWREALDAAPQRFSRRHHP